MSEIKHHPRIEATGGERPPGGGRPEPDASTGTQGPTSGRPQSRKRSRRKRPYRIYTPEQRRQAVEAYLQSGMSQDEFTQVWGISKASLHTWLTRYKESGPKALERKQHAGKGQSRLGSTVRTEIVQAKHTFPSFGLKRLRDWLFRFRGIKVSTGAIRNTLEKVDTPPQPPVPQRRRRRKPAVHRFERSRPGELWQSDITSAPLARQGVRTYLTVFLDDHSRYVVSWALALHQKQELVVEALLQGIDRFGKPEEVLTDQGRQYYSWRGRSGFQKLLDKQGIRHVVARSHHPQTLGKCERLWKTLREEFWSRVAPQDLAEARERLGHFLSHFNHYRPHQGIGGMVPADRFFGVESDIRQALEEQHAERELDLALSEAPRKRVYLVGRIGDREVSMHGERGRLVVHTPDGAVAEMDTERLGMPQEGEHERAADGIDETSAGAEETAGGVQPIPTRAGSGAGAMAGGERGGAPEGACNRGGDPGAVAGPFEPQGDLRAAGDPSAEDLAVVPASTGRPGGWSAETAAVSAGRSDLGGDAGAAEKEGAKAGSGVGEPEAAGGAAQGDAGTAAERTPIRGGRHWREKADNKGGCLEKSGGQPEEGSTPREPAERSDW